MAFTCKPCHDPERMGGWCKTMFNVGSADSYGPCENCGVPSACMDCPCPVVQTEKDEPGCNMCDGFVYEGDTCPCGLVGTQKRPDHSQHGLGNFDPTCDNCQRENELSASIVAEVMAEERPTCRGCGRRIRFGGPDSKYHTACDPETTTVLLPNWQRCPKCGKTGNHTHNRGVARALGKSMMLDYYADAEPRVFKAMVEKALGRSLTDAEMQAAKDELLKRFPAIAVYYMHDSVVMALGDVVEGGVEHDEVALRDAMGRLRRQPDPEHEPDNPNCLCFQPECITRHRIRLPRRRDG